MTSPVPSGDIPADESVIDLGYMSLPAEVQQAVEVHVAAHDPLVLPPGEFALVQRLWLAVRKSCACGGCKEFIAGLVKDAESGSEEEGRVAKSASISVDVTGLPATEAALAALRARADVAEARLAAIAEHCRLRMSRPGRSGMTMAAAGLILGLAEGRADEEEARDGA
jgi:hypothetical protein